ncbi:MAG: phosphoribosylformylglycinamidine synthase, partial [Clostridia bacterium]|nr:phosphoribosylformylglycinamidine synthase [Clostridia bacterium]
MVFRVYVEKKEGLNNEAKALLSEIRDFLGIRALKSLRVINRYDAENIDTALFEYAKRAVFSEPQIDLVFDELKAKGRVFAVEYLPGQFDQRADSASQCIQILSCGERPSIRTAKVYVLEGDLSDTEADRIKNYVINPVEAREADLALPDTLYAAYDLPTSVRTLEGFSKLDKAGLKKFIAAYGLAMDEDDIAFCQRYFAGEKREPTITEIRMIDTYWSDHCRHTTFLTTIDKVTFEDDLIQNAYNEYLALRKELKRTKPVCLMDVATLAVRELKRQGKLDKLDESEEINACTVKIDVDVDGVTEKWLLLFKNETHNHPTEIDPFGGAATCIGGAIRDPFSGRSYVYAAMRVTGAADPLLPVEETIKGKLPQRKIVTTAAAGYSSYGNQIGLATGLVEEIYHEGYAAKRMEIGAVIAATPAENVRRETPAPGDVVILLGGRTGRDGIGGATGSSKSHNAHSVETCGAEVQKGNAPEERKLQRLFRNKEACGYIKRCNDFGAGGVSVAVGELADGLSIDLNAVPKKYEGLDGTELAISESQERMAVVIEKENVARFIEIAGEENLEACPVAVVTEEPRLRMQWNGVTIVDVSREFLNSNGAEKHIDVVVKGGKPFDKETPTSFKAGYEALVKDLNVCSKRGLSERFDSTIGAGTVLMPFGGKYQLTPIQAMVQKISVEKKHTDDCSVMAYGYDPYIMEKDQYRGAYLSVVESVCKLIATGASFKEVYLSFQEYFERLGKDPEKWGKPLSALLGAFKAQLDLGIGSIGGKDSMSGTFEDISVPPTLVSFAVTTEKVTNILSDDMKKAGHKVIRIAARKDANGLPDAKSLIAVFDKVHRLIEEKKAFACWTPVYGGIAEGILKMCLGNGLGFAYRDALTLDDIFGYDHGAFLIETEEDFGEEVIGDVLSVPEIVYRGEVLPFEKLREGYEEKLESVYPTLVSAKSRAPETYSYTGIAPTGKRLGIARPRVLIPVFPGTNCEYDSAKAFTDAGAEAEKFVINNLTKDGIQRSVADFAKKIRAAQMVFIPGGFSGGDEPDGSGKFITAFFRNAEIKENVTELLERRDGLMAGICNGFQALIKLGLVPFGKIIDTDENCPTLTFNTIGRHQSKIVRTRVVSNMSPWLRETSVGDVYNVPISHGEGRFIASDSLVKELARNGQIATQYVDIEGRATDDIRYNPNGSVAAVEGITSPDGRVFGKMGHSERWGNGLYKNVPGDYDIKMFRSA